MMAVMMIPTVLAFLALLASAPAGPLPATQISVLQCSLNCATNFSSETPVCGQDGMIYSSSCLLGCHALLQAPMSNCTTEDAKVEEKVGFEELDGEYGGGTYLGVLLGGVDEFKKALDQNRLDGWVSISPSPLPARRDLLQATIYGDNGVDDRVQVMDLGMLPFNQLGLVTPSHCTGSIVGPRHILTSAHCLFDLDRNGWVSNLSFLPAANMTRKGQMHSIPFQYVMAKKCYVDESRRECDFGMGILPYDIPGIDGWFEIGTDCNGTEDPHLYTAGYPLDKPPGSLWAEDCGETNISCSSDSQIVQHTCDVVPGMSGAPLWDDRTQIRAIHRGEERIFGSSNNIAVYVNKHVHKSVQDWIGGPDRFLWEVRENRNQLHLAGKLPVLYTTDAPNG